MVPEPQAATQSTTRTRELERIGVMSVGSFLQERDARHIRARARCLVATPWGGGAPIPEHGTSQPARCFPAYHHAQLVPRRARRATPPGRGGEPPEPTTSLATVVMQTATRGRQAPVRRTAPTRPGTSRGASLARCCSVSAAIVMATCRHRSPAIRAMPSSTQSRSPSARARPANARACVMIGTGPNCPCTAVSTYLCTAEKSAVAAAHTAYRHWSDAWLDDGERACRLRFWIIRRQLQGERPRFNADFFHTAGHSGCQDVHLCLQIGLGRYVLRA